MTFISLFLEPGCLTILSIYFHFRRNERLFNQRFNTTAEDIHVYVHFECMRAENLIWPLNLYLLVCHCHNFLFNWWNSIISLTFFIKLNVQYHFFVCFTVLRFFWAPIILFSFLIRTKNLKMNKCMFHNISSRNDVVGMDLLQNLWFISWPKMFNQ